MRYYAFVLIMIASCKLVLAWPNEQESSLTIWIQYIKEKEEKKKKEEKNKQAFSDSMNI